MLRISYVFRMIGPTTPKFNILSQDSSNAEATFIHSTRTQTLLKTCHLGIHLIALTEYSHISTHMPGFQLFSALWCHFEWARLSSSHVWSHNCQHVTCDSISKTHFSSNLRLCNFSEMTLISSDRLRLMDLILARLPTRDT